jgi:adenosylhomocysteine nucleosidase
MEGGAVGQVCAANGVPFAVMRAISDGGDENAAMDYPTFKKIAAELSATILTRFVSEEQTQESLF